MTQPGNSSDRNHQQPYVFSMRLATVGAQVGCLTLAIVFLGLFGGLWLDRLLGTKPLFTIMLVLGAAPLSLFLTFWMAMRAVRDLNLPSPAGAKPSPGKEEETSE
jgi:F0F1-type ATP synthase assembly protein I